MASVSTGGRSRLVGFHCAKFATLVAFCQAGSVRSPSTLIGVSMRTAWIDGLRLGWKTELLPEACALSPGARTLSRGACARAAEAKTAIAAEQDKRDGIDEIIENPHGRGGTGLGL